MKLRSWSGAAGVALILCGSAVMVGWALRLPLWEFASPAGTVMVFQTAFCFALAGIALTAPPHEARGRKIRVVAGGIIAAVALMAFAEAVFSIDLGNDLAALHSWYRDANPHPGRMAPNTAAGFLLAGASLALGAAGNRSQPLLLAIPAAVFTLGALGLAGYTSLLDLVYSRYDVPRMAASTASAMMALGAGLMADHRAAAKAGEARAAEFLPHPAMGAWGYAFLGAAMTILAMISFVSYGSLDALARHSAIADTQGKSISAAMNTILAGNLLGFSILLYAGWILKRQNAQRDKLVDALRSSNAFLDSLVEHIPSMVFVKDAEHLRFVRLNRAGENLLGFPRADLIGKGDYDFFPREEADFFTARDRTALAGNAVVDIPEESIHTRFNGTRILHTRKIPICDEQGQPQYLLGISDDITEQKRTAQKIVALNASLKARADELEAANKELENFAYSVSHDLRAPLRAINGYALMLEEDYRNRLDSEAMRYIAQVRAYSAQMGALIDDLLELSRLGRQEIRTVDVDSKELVDKVLQAELRAWQGPVPTIEVGALPGVKADPLLLRQVWINLISNALKYSGKNPAPVIEIGGYDQGDETIFRIKDNGVGFDMAYYDKLFNAFQRLHRADEFPGTGIGLAIVHRIVTRHRGRVWARGEPDKGAEFFFALPNRVTYGAGEGI